MRTLIAVALIGVLLLSWTDRCTAEAAIALGRGPNGTYWWGGASNHTTLREARAAALARCRRRGPNCSVIMTFRKGCFAFATSAYGRAYSMGAQRTLREARAHVLSRCRRISRGRPCVVKKSFCDSVDEADVRRRRQAERREAERLEAERREAQRRAEQEEWERREHQRREAERREWERQEARLRDARQREWDEKEAERRAGIRSDNIWNTAFPATTAISIVIGVLLAALTAIAKSELPVGVKIAIAILAPLASIFLKNILDIELAGGITLFDFVLLNIPGGGVLVGAIVYKLTA